jgi:Cu-processing system ATP-binding protein
MITPALELTDIHKRFGRLVVLDGVTASVVRGRVTAVVGPNASGKSTLIKCVLGLVRPDAGKITVLGTRVGRDPGYRRRVGFMPQGATFPENLTGQEVLDLVHAVRPDDPVDLDLVYRFALEAQLGTRVRVYSGGTRQKLNAAVAFMFRPELLILDEPTAGLDPLASVVFKDKVKEVAAEGASVLLTSHVLSEVEELADDVLFLLDGKVRFQGTMEDLRRMTGEQRLERAVSRLMRMRAA